MSINMLFVDDEQDILDALENRFHAIRHFWHVRFANSAATALSMLSEEPADVVVSDMRMPDMDGAQLMAHIKHLWPATIRIMLSGETGNDHLLQATADAHQVLAKPCDVDLLKEKVGQAIRLRNCLSRPEVVQAVSRLGSLPALPELSQRLHALCVSGKASFEGISALIEQDPAMTARIMQLANAANIDGMAPVQHVREAVVRLGLDLVSSLIITESLFLQVTPGSGIHQAISECQAATLRMARLASELADPPELKQTVFAVAMLRSVGDLALCLISKDDPIPIPPAVLSGYLLSLWGFPLDQVAAVTFSHAPMMGNPGPDDPATVVHVANALQLHLERKTGGNVQEVVDPDWLAQCPGSEQTLKYWLRVAKAFNEERPA